MDKDRERNCNKPWVRIVDNRVVASCDRLTDRILNCGGDLGSVTEEVQKIVRETEAVIKACFSQPIEWNIDKIESLHNHAMALVDKAFVVLKRDSNVKKYLALCRDAYLCEAEAARLTSVGIEPTRSVLYRSAASLAIECGEDEDAMRLITEGLAGNPPAEIAQELEDLKESLE